MGDSRKIQYEVIGLPKAKAVAEAKETLLKWKDEGSEINSHFMIGVLTSVLNHEDATPRRKVNEAKAMIEAYHEVKGWSKCT